GPAGPDGGRGTRRGGGRTRRRVARGGSASRRDLGRTLVHGNRLPGRLLHQLPPVPAVLPGAGPGQVLPGGGPAMTEPREAEGLLVLAPLRIEAAALRRALPGAEIVRTGM